MYFLSSVLTSIHSFPWIIKLIVRHQKKNFASRVLVKFCLKQGQLKVNGILWILAVYYLTLTVHKKGHYLCQSSSKWLAPFTTLGTKATKTLWENSYAASVFCRQNYDLKLHKLNYLHYYHIKSMKALSSNVRLLFTAKKTPLRAFSICLPCWHPTSLQVQLTCHCQTLS